MVSYGIMMRFLLVVCGLLLPACSGGNQGSTPSTPAGLDDSNAQKQLDAELAKPLPDLWKDTTIALITDPVAMCNKAAIETQVKNEATTQADNAKKALQDAGLAIQESTDNASVVFSIRILANCSGNGPPLVTGDVSAMPGNGAVAAKSDLFEISRFDAGKVTLALLRHQTLVERMQAK